MNTEWQYLEQRPHPWRKQLYLKGRRLKAFDLWANMIANEMTLEEVADNWDLPLEAVRESIEYCETYQDLLRQEAEIERCHLEERGIPLSLRLLLDEDIQAKLLVILLKKADHDALTINDVNLTGQVDLVVLDYARQTNRILVTQNCYDFEDLHNINPNHPGIIAIYHEDNPLKDMNFKAMVKAIANLEAANIPLANQFIALNHWNY